MEHSSLIKFVERYKDKQMPFLKMKKLWKEKIDKKDFDNNEEEVFLWFQEYRKKILHGLGRVA